MKNTHALIVSAAMVISMLPGAVFAQAVAPDVSSVSAFTIFAGNGLTSFGSTRVYGDVAISPGTTYSILSPGQISGNVHQNDGTANSAKASLDSAFPAFMAQTCEHDLQPINGDVLFSPGSYCRVSDVKFNGDITLDGLGDKNSMFVFRAGTDFMTGDSTVMHLTNEASFDHVYFIAGGNATLGDTSQFFGTVIAGNNVVVRSNATVKGHLYAKDGTVDLSNDVVLPSSVADLSLTLVADNVGVQAGGNIVYTLTVKNSGPDVAGNVTVWDGLPQQFSLTSSTPSKGSWMNGLWSLGSLAVNETAAVTLVMNVPSTVPEATYVNTAEIQSSDAADTDSVVNDHVPGEDDIASVSVGVIAASLPPQNLSYNPVAERAAATTIDADRGSNTTLNSTPCAIGTVIKGPSFAALYYCSQDGKRYVFPDQKTFMTWYPNFDNVIHVSDQLLISIPLGGVVRYKPGVRLVKIQTDPKVYAISKNGLLRHIGSESIAAQLYGADWVHAVDDIPDAFFTNYTIGTDIMSQ